MNTAHTDGDVAREWQWCVVDGAQMAHIFGATTVADLLNAAVAKRDRATLAVSGGTTGRAVVEALAAMQVEWDRVQVGQVDERLVARDDPARHEPWMAAAVGSRARLWPMPVELAAGDPAAAVASYTATLQSFAGDPPVFDVVHLGLGADGHSASLFVRSAELDCADVCCVTAEQHEGWRRMTLSLPTLARARHVVIVATGTDKADALERLARGDVQLPATHLRGEVTVVCDVAAASRMPRLRGAPWATA